jgi:DNA-directed RNA polymerase specialized sigma24 family protein
MTDAKAGAAPPEALLAEARWLRRLATSLIGEDAEDLVQATYLAALRSPPAGDRPLRPWLGRVRRHLLPGPRAPPARSAQEAEDARDGLAWEVGRGQPLHEDGEAARRSDRSSVGRSLLRPSQSG